MVRASLNLSARVVKSSIYFCEKSTMKISNSFRPIYYMDLGRERVKLSAMILSKCL